MVKKTGCGELRECDLPERNPGRNPKSQIVLECTKLEPEAALVNAAVLLSHFPAQAARLHCTPARLNRQAVQ